MFVASGIDLLGRQGSTAKERPRMSDGPILDQINLVVSDMEASVKFYRLLGLTIPDTDPGFQAHHRSAQLAGGVDFDIDSVEFARHWDGGWKSGTGVIGFKVATREQVDAVYADLMSAGYVGQQEPYDAFWGARYAIIEDPDGNPVGLMSPVDPGRRTAPGFPRPPS
jgi:catechol 2,3-dioxygenase-like lactoylglutathione lyase family enzyme